METGVELIKAERARQVSQEGWTPEHDDEHSDDQLAQAAACYAWPRPRPVLVKQAWPWDRKWWKPALPEGEAGGNGGLHFTEAQWRDARVRELVKAGALIAAEIDRLIRAGALSGDSNATQEDALSSSL